MQEDDVFESMLLSEVAVGNVGFCLRDDYQLSGRGLCQSCVYDITKLTHEGPCLFAEIEPAFDRVYRTATLAEALRYLRSST